MGSLSAVSQKPSPYPLVLADGNFLQHSAGWLELLHLNEKQDHGDAPVLSCYGSTDACDGVCRLRAAGVVSVTYGPWEQQGKGWRRFWMLYLQLALSIAAEFPQQH